MALLIDVLLMIKRIIGSRSIAIVALAAWLGGVTFGSLYKFEKSDDIPSFEHMDKVVHFTFYLVTSLLICHLFSLYGKKRGVATTISLLIATVYSSTIELLQPYFERSCSGWDAVANIAGALGGCAIFWVLSRRR